MATKPWPGRGFGFTLQQHPPPPDPNCCGERWGLPGRSLCQPGPEQPALTEPFLIYSRPSPPCGGGKWTLPPWKPPCRGGPPVADSPLVMPAAPLHIA